MAAIQVFISLVVVISIAGHLVVSTNETATIPTPDSFGDGDDSGDNRTAEVSSSSPVFHIEADGDNSDSVLNIQFSPSKEFLHYKANYSDLSAISNGTHNAPTSALFNSSPFRLTGLSAGHQYKVEFYGFDSGENPQLMQIEVVSTAPSPPAFNLSSVSTTNVSITLVPLTPVDPSRHQYLFVRYDSDRHQKTLNFSDAKKPTTSLTIDHLLPGRLYNLSVFMINKSGLWSKPWNSPIITTNPNPPTEVSVKERGANHLLIEWKRPEDSGVDEYHISYQDIRGGNPIDIPLIPAGNSSLTLTKGIDPGKTYFISVYSLKGSMSSSQSTVTAVSRPLPPTSIEIFPDFERLKFRIRVSGKRNEVNLFNGCRLEISSALSPNKTNETVAAQKEFCDFYAVLSPGDSYTFRSWTLSGQDESSSEVEKKVTTVVYPAFDEGKFGVKLVVDPTTIRVTWESAAVAKFWPSMVGPTGNFSARLRRDSGVDTIGVSPFGADAASSLSFGGLTYGTCYSVEIYTTTAGVISNITTKHIRTAVPETAVMLKAIAARSVDLLVDLQMSAVSKTSLVSDASNLADKPGKEESQKKDVIISVDRSCRIMVQMIADNQSVVANQTLDNLNVQAKPWIVRFANLQPFRRYLASVFQQCGGSESGESQCSSQRTKFYQIQFMTNEGFPGPVRSVEASVLNSYSVNLSWVAPAEPNGIIIGYAVGVAQHKTPFAPEQQWNITLSNRTYYLVLDNLTGGFSYDISVRAINSIGQSIVEEPVGSDWPGSWRKRVETPIRAPPQPTATPVPTSNSITQTSFQFSFDLKSFSLRNGLLTKYAVIVSEASSQLPQSNDPSNETLSWAEVQNLDVWTPYIAVLKALVVGAELNSFDFVIGEGHCGAISKENIRVVNQLRNPDFYCNGPLRSDRRYKVKVRGYTGNGDDLFSDSAYSAIITTEAEITSPAGPIVAGVVIVLILVIVVITATLFLRTRGYDPFLWLKGQARGNGPSHNGMTNKPRRSAAHQSNGVGAGGKMRPPPPGLPGRGCEPIVDPRLSRIHQLPAAHTVMPGADIERSRPVRKNDFSEHFRLMSADTDYRFSEEFEDLKSVGRGQSRSAADLPCNRAKNRFTNILPYDHSRVKLIPIDDEEGSEYINANYIPGFSSPREYIAAQGPLHSTRDDFWRMMWEQNCRNIVNLTRCIEKGREKCDQYWPIDTDPVYYGDVQVVLLNETRLPEWTIRELEMTCGNVVRIIKHFHYTAWPDFGVPDKPQSLVKFVKTFRSKMAKENGPIVVHCSAGVGRSGTFIAIDRLMQLIQSNDVLDIFGTVFEMRKERECMVQTEHQYICIHQVMLCVIDGREDELGYALPYAEVHENPVFEDDEGIAESGF